MFVNICINTFFLFLFCSITRLCLIRPVFQALWLLPTHSNYELLMGSTSITLTVLQDSINSFAETASS